MLVDLFLGGPIGLWMLDQVDPADIGCVYTDDWAIDKRAGNLGANRIGSFNRAKIGLSVHYPHLLSVTTLDRYDAIYNIHPALLPMGRCYYPVFWALWNGEPAGCTLHQIAPGIDDGPIVAQRRVPQYDWDTGGSLHARVSDAEKGLLLEYWPRLAKGEPLPTTPQQGPSTFHLKQDFFDLKRTAPIEAFDGTQLLKLIQALSHEQYTGLELTIDGHRFEVSMRELP